jgi:hypothetical protein
METNNGKRIKLHSSLSKYNSEIIETNDENVTVNGHKGHNKTSRNKFYKINLSI